MISTNLTVMFLFLRPSVEMHTTVCD
jgi:hypothetical protein